MGNSRFLVQALKLPVDTFLFPKKHRLRHRCLLFRKNCFQDITRTASDFIKEMTVSGIISALSGKHCICQLHADPQAGIICSLVKFSRVCGNPEMTCLSLIADSASYFGKSAFSFGKQVFRSKPADHLRCIFIFSCCIGY